MMRLLRLIVALVTLVALAMLAIHWETPTSTGASARSVDALGIAFTPLPDQLTGATISIGLLLLGSWFFGRAFKAIRLPKLSGYLVFGMILGPHALGVITKEQLPSLHLAESLAISLIALTAGGEIELSSLGSSLRLIFSVAAAQLMAVFAAITLVVYAFAPSVGLTDPAAPEVRFIAALIAGAIATAASPAVFIAVMNELGATGKSIQAALSIMISKDLVLIVGFAIILAIAGALLHPSTTQTSERAPNMVPNTSALTAEQKDNTTTNTSASTIQPVSDAEPSTPTPPSLSMRAVAGGLSVHLLGSLAAGVVFGLAFAWYMHSLRTHLAIFVVAGCLSIAITSQRLHLEPLIVALVAGVLMRNVWRERVGPFFHTMEDLSLPVYCVFFAVAGAKLQFEGLGAIWLAVLALVAVRALAIWAGTHLGCRLANHGPPMRTWLWTAYIPQAGVSVALISIAASTFKDESFAQPLYSLVLASIALHELLGPIVLKLGLQRLDQADRSSSA